MLGFVLLLHAVNSKLNAQCSPCFPNFSISNTGCSAVLSWSSYGQSSTLGYFSIQRSEDNGTNFYEIGTKSVTPGSSASYTYTDDNPPMQPTPPTTMKYRVMAVRNTDAGGTFSSVLSTTFFCIPVPPTIFPCSNPPVIVAPASVGACGLSVPISVGNSTPQTTIWTSSNPAVLLIGSNNFSHGTVMIPQAPGTAIITITQPWCGQTIQKTITVVACPNCNNIITPLSAFRGCNGNPTCPYENYTWTGSPTASLYSIESVVFNTSTGVTRPTVYFQTIGGVISGNTLGATYTREVLSGTGWVIRFRVAAKCSITGIWEAYGPWSSNFVY